MCATFEFGGISSEAPTYVKHTLFRIPNKQIYSSFFRDLLPMLPTCAVELYRSEDFIFPISSYKFYGTVLKKKYVFEIFINYIFYSKIDLLKYFTTEGLKVYV